MLVMVIEIYDTVFGGSVDDHAIPIIATHGFLSILCLCLFSLVHQPPLYSCCIATCFDVVSSEYDVESEFLIWKELEAVRMIFEFFCRDLDIYTRIISPSRRYIEIFCNI